MHPDIKDPMDQPNRDKGPKAVPSQHVARRKCLVNNRNIFKLESELTTEQTLQVRGLAEV